MPVNLLLILAIAASAIFALQELPWGWHVLAFAAAGLTGTVVVSKSARRLGIPISDLREAARVNSAFTYAMVLSVAAISFIVAIGAPLWAWSLLGLSAAWVIVWWPRRLRTFTLSSNIVINRDPAAVFALVGDLQNQPRFWATVESVEKVTPGAIGPGSRFATRTTVSTGTSGLPVVFDLVEEIVDYQPNRLISTRDASSLNFNLDSISLEPTSGGTRVTHRLRYVHPYTTAVLAATIRFGPSTARQIKANRTISWTRAKELLESEEQTTT